MSFVPKPKALFILSSHSKFGDSGNPTGWYLPEFAHSYAVLAPHAEISVASPAGGEAPLDPGSVELFKEDPVCVSFYKQQSHLWKNSEKLENYIGKAADFDLIYVVGGHGPLWDLTDNTSLQKLLAEFYDSGKVVAAVCHGTCALLNVKLTNGELIIKDQPVTGFSNDEEKQIGLDEAVPFSLETELIRKGGKYEKASAPWAAHVSVGRNGRIITGQNPASAAGIAELFLKYYNSGRK
ncbi:class I glutamine amidotransferase-like protein [Terfezia claveryi]|nr:class I glutamine amidotransferase-like protein [Terfezia claveryi]